MVTFIIGIDIGGTHTDAVLVDAQQKIVSHAKISTTESVEIGFEQVLQRLLKNSGVSAGQIAAIKIGTTHATNALLQAKNLLRIGAIRLAGENPLLPVGFHWPQTLIDKVLVGEYCIAGGYECDGRETRPLDTMKFKEAIAQLIEQGAEGIVVTGVFSPLYPQQELSARALVPCDVPLCLSSEVSGMGFLERENTAILNLALRRAMQQGFDRLEEKARACGCMCPVFLTQNNGSIISLADALQHPIKTLSAGQTNSFIGGAKLAGSSDALVVDIGGTSTDIGFVRSGFPKQSLAHVDIGGVTVNIVAPDVKSLSLGGGSIIHADGTIGPESVGRELKEKAFSFGGSILTLTDIMLFCGIAFIPETDSSCIPLAKVHAAEIASRIIHTLSQTIAKQKNVSACEKVVLVGGGSQLFKDLPLDPAIVIPPFAEVANAYGAALAEISHTIDTTISGENRDEQLIEIETKALHGAIEQGASPDTVRLISQEIMPYHYMPGLRARVVVTAAG